MAREIRRTSRLLWGLLLVLGGAFAFGTQQTGVRRQAPADDVLLDREVESCVDGNHLSFRVARPGRYEIHARGPDDAALRVEIGPALPVDERLGVWLPDPQRSFRLDTYGEGRIDRRLDVVGTYALRLEPIPTAMESMTSKVRITVRRMAETGPAAP